MRITDTELDYKNEDSVALDYYLGGGGETKEQWAKRVWDNCRLHSEGTFVSSVYDAKPGQTWQDRAKELWDNKKNKRREALGKEFKKGNDDASMNEIKSDSKYKTRDQRHQEEQASRGE